MKYIISGHFLNGDQWEETANGKKELLFILEKVRANGACATGWTVTQKNARPAEKMTVREVREELNRQKARLEKANGLYKSAFLYRVLELENALEDKKNTEETALDNFYKAQAKARRGKL